MTLVTITRGALVAAGGGSQAPPDSELLSVTLVPTVNLSGAPIAFALPLGDAEILDDQFMSAAGAVTQLDRAVAYGGSTRHVLLTVDPGALTAGVSKVIVLGPTSQNAPGTALTRSDLPAGFSAEIELTTPGISASVTAAGMPSETVVFQPRNGPLCSEWIIRKAMSADFFAEFHVALFSDDRVRVRYVVERSSIAGSGAATIATVAVLRLNGSDVFSGSVTHRAYSRWTKVFWTPSDPQVEVRLPRTFMQATKFVPNYDPAVTLPGSTLDAAQSSWNAAPKTPMAAGEYEVQMDQGGGRSDIALVPRWCVRHVMSPDPRTRSGAIGNEELSGSWPIHYRTSAGAIQQITASNWTDTYPGSYTERDPVNGFAPDWSHQPLVGYYAYLITGEYYFLEEHQHWANWCMLSRDSSAGMRNGTSGYLDNDQTRATAWDTRTLGCCARITPDAHALKSYFTEKIGNNLTRYLSRYVNGSESPLGFLPEIYPPDSNDDACSPWMQDFVVQCIGWLADLDFADALTLVREGFGRHVAFRLGPGNPGDFPWPCATSYRMAYQENNVLITSRRRIFEWTLTETGLRASNGITATEANNVIAAAVASQAMYDNLPSAAPSQIWAGGGGNPDDPESYVANLQASIAAAVDARVLGADYAYRRFNLHTGALSYTVSPQFGIRPRRAFSSQTSVIANVSAGTWTNITSSLAVNIDNIANGQGVDGNKCAYSSGAGYDADQHRFYFGPAGGHFNHGSDDILYLDLVSLEWIRPYRSKTDLDGIGTDHNNLRTQVDGLYSDAKSPNTTGQLNAWLGNALTPIARHDYGANCYVDGWGHFLAGGFGWSEGGFPHETPADIWRYQPELETGTGNGWTRMGSGYSGYTNFNGDRMTACSAIRLSRADSRVYIRDNASGVQTMLAYDPWGNTMASVNQNSTVDGGQLETSWCFDKARNRIWKFGSTYGSANLMYFEFTSLTSGSWIDAGDASPPAGGNGCGLVWVERYPNTLFHFNGATGRVTEYDIPTTTWRASSAVGPQTPIEPYTWRRFDHDRVNDAFLQLRPAAGGATTGWQTWVYKPSASAA